MGVRFLVLKGKEVMSLRKRPGKYFFLLKLVGFDLHLKTGFEYL